jgi:hypothetical protein
MHQNNQAFIANSEYGFGIGMCSARSSGSPAGLDRSLDQASLEFLFVE